MRRCIFILSCLLTLGASAQQKMRQVFIHMPDSIIGYLSENNRLDFFDFIDSKMEAEVSNAFDGKSRMLSLTDAYLQLALNDCSRLEMRLLDTAEEVDSARQIVCLVRTYGKDYCESTVDFYSLKWRKLSAAQYVSLPDGLHTVHMDEHQPLMLIETFDALDRPASEEQKVSSKTSKSLNWDGRNFN